MQRIRPIYEISGPSTFTIPKGTQFSGQNSNGSFIFTTSVAQSFNSVTSTYIVDNLKIYEGFFIDDVYVMDYSIDSQKFLLSNPKIDTDSLTVTVIEVLPPLSFPIIVMLVVVVFAKPALGTNLNLLPTTA